MQSVDKKHVIVLAPLISIPCTLWKTRLQSDYNNLFYQIRRYCQGIGNSYYFTNREKSRAIQ